MNPSKVRAKATCPIGGYMSPFLNCCFISIVAATATGCRSNGFGVKTATSGGSRYDSQVASFYTESCSRALSTVQHGLAYELTCDYNPKAPELFQAHLKCLVSANQSFLVFVIYDSAHSIDYSYFVDSEGARLIDNVTGAVIPVRIPDDMFAHSSGDLHGVIGMKICLILRAAAAINPILELANGQPNTTLTSAQERQLFNLLYGIDESAAGLTRLSVLKDERSLKVNWEDRHGSIFEMSTVQVDSSWAAKMVNRFLWGLSVPSVPPPRLGDVIKYLAARGFPSALLAQASLTAPDGTLVLIDQSDPRLNDPSASLGPIQVGEIKINLAIAGPEPYEGPLQGESANWSHESAEPISGLTTLKYHRNSAGLNAGTSLQTRGQEWAISYTLSEDAPSLDDRLEATMIGFLQGLSANRNLSPGDKGENKVNGP
jgi:hypothetical protein